MSRLLYLEQTPIRTLVLDTRYLVLVRALSKLLLGISKGINSRILGPGRSSAGVALRPYG